MPPTANSVVDVLEIIPLDDARTNVWLKLPAEDRHQLRSVSRAFICLADVLTRHVTYIYRATYPAFTADSGVDHEEQPYEDYLLHPLASTWPPTRALLERLPSLTSLCIRVNEPHDLHAAIAQAGASPAARAGQVTRLHLLARAVDVNHVLAALYAFPQLHALHLSVEVSMGHLFALPPPARQPSAPHPWAALTELEVDVDVFSSSLLRSVGSLTQLRSVAITFFQPLPRDQDDSIDRITDRRLLSSWGALIHLRSCKLFQAYDYFEDGFTTLDACMPLLGLAGLTHLSVVSVEQDGGAAYAPEQLAALRALTGLVDLQLGGVLKADTAMLDVLMSLHLTTLGIGSAEQLPPPRVTADQQQQPLSSSLAVLYLGRLSPKDLLATLRALHPLPALTNVGRSVPSGGLSRDWDVLEVDVTGRMAYNGEMSAALEEAAQLLQDAPLLRCVHVSVLCNECVVGDGDVYGVAAKEDNPCSVSDLVHFLAPDGSGRWGWGVDAHDDDGLLEAIEVVADGGAQAQAAADAGESGSLEDDEDEEEEGGEEVGEEDEGEEEGDGDAHAAGAAAGDDDDDDEDAGDGLHEPHAWRALTEGLVPVRHKVRSFSLSRALLPDDVRWSGGESGLFPALTTIRLERCILKDAALLAVVAAHPRLTLLMVDDCEGLTQAGWEALVGVLLSKGARGERVDLHVSPRVTLPAALRLRMEVHGGVCMVTRGGGR